MADYREFVPDVHFELIPIKRLVSNQDYQRNLSLQHIKKTAENFDLYQINPVKVSRRNGVNYVFNGQHTIEIVAMVSGSRDTPVWCMVYDDMDYRIEADVFANQQKYVKTLAPYEIFMANIEAENDFQVAIKTLVESYDLTISKVRAPGMICAVSSLELIYEKYGFHVLDRTIRLCVGTWEGEAGSLSSGILKGIAILVAVFGDSLRDDIFKEKVGVYSSRDITRLAKERKAGSMGYAEAMLIAYNRKSKKGLSWAKLYSGRKKQTDEAGFEEYAEEEETNDQEALEQADDGE
ncbi:DUF6551 family protein [Succiniclasticum ruminis]|uniref:ParB-like nuclease domain-containing protein n=1 Tax=Succiniclasticum ruminis DSM 9236 TaxID=1123323 RepID=A0A1I1YB15_9FIRM|nr:DUF6551 family protein [Succiniclasticum ruminis]SFE16756.1 hypothetical protein SAMN05216245_102122 [Succiniclasticum ruminis DSM 9236]